MGDSITSIRSFPLYTELQKFLQTRLFAVEERISEEASSKPVPLLKFTSSKPVQMRKPNLSVKTSYVTAKQSENKMEKCSLCRKDFHPGYQCDVFRGKKPKERLHIAKKECLCVLCLHSGHTLSSCPNAAAKFKCSCGEPHNYLLHFGRAFSKKEQKLSLSVDIPG